MVFICVPGKTRYRCKSTLNTETLALWDRCFVGWLAEVRGWVCLTGWNAVVSLRAWPVQVMSGFLQVGRLD